jgi:CBS domain-containing protein
MNVTVNDLMVSRVMTTTLRQTYGHVKKVLNDHSVSCIPVVDGENEPVGMVTTTDFLEARPDETPVEKFMETKVYSVPRYADPSLAARIMRNHHIHHIVVTDEKKVVGILSSFDLLRLVEEHRFVMKNPPDVSKSKRGKRTKDELSE